MFCPQCQNQIADDARFCSRCGGKAVAAPHSIGDDAGMRLLLPVGRSVWAIIAGYLGLFSVLVFPAPFAVIVGIVAVLDIRRHPKKHGMGRAIFGIVMGGLVILALATVFVVGMLQAARHS